ncbi:metal/formaldehyde-sensitive transcriptional repressor [Herminiimonas arsenitoxidans]|uniref:metal/formaldehyde-sensitive transcriptional repressor n=1 Tax=Herminiimonas arsenitoxidans TaxID=1809410 RepID=UPI000970444E|nr:metal/formaldehyde-sensitive transcriptional repressor [Herminiimonas arsenitoxidans]
MSHVKENKKLLARIRRMKGQVIALEKALEGDSDCGAVLQQIAAIRGAANGLMGEVLESHIREHLGENAASAQERQDDIEQVVSVLRSYLK